MHKAIEQLRLTLTQQLENYEQLLELAESKNKLLMIKAATELHEIVAKEELLVQNLIDLEEPRKNIVKLITNDSNSKFEMVLDAITDTEAKSDLWVLSDKLNATVEKVNLLNTKNQKLVEQALELTLYSLKLITRAPRPVTYGPSGKSPSQMPQTRSLINKKA